jgi:hypothetical protein
LPVINIRGDSYRLKEKRKGNNSIAQEVNTKT